MYEIVKKKNIWTRILIGILGLFILTQLLKYFLKEPELNINDDLIKVSNEINKHAPIIIDSLLTLENVNALKKNTLIYNYSVKTSKSAVDTIELIKASKEFLVENLKKNPNIKIFRDNNVIIQAVYKDSNQIEICKITVLPNEY